MGTAVLLPRDCLPISKSRHQNNFSDVIYGSESSLRARGSTFQVLDPCSFYPDHARSVFVPNGGVNWSGTCGHLPPPPHGSASLHVKSLQKEADGKKMKARRPTDPRDAKHAAKSGLDGPVFTILQRPKDKDVADKLIAKFLVKVDEVKSRNVAPHAGLKDDEFKFRNGIRNAILDMKKGGSNLKKGTSDLKTEGLKCRDAKSEVVQPQVLVWSSKLDRSSTLKDSKVERVKHHVGASRPVNIAKRDFYGRSDDLEPPNGLNQMLSLNVAGEHKSLQTTGVSCKLAYTNQPTGVDGVGLTRLRRASTDPQMVKQLVNQYRSNVMEIPSGEAKSYHGFTRTTSMSCPERWAGPAYSSSPAPSALPLPKFSLPNQKAPSLDSAPLFVEQHSRNTIQPPELGSVFLLPGSSQGRELDVASATKSLRKMLKLDPF